MSIPIKVFEYQVKIKPEAIDLNGHVNNVFYITWMQNASVAHSTANGLAMDDYVRMQRSWVVGSHTIDYLRPILADDEIRIETWLYKYGKRDVLRNFHFLRGDKVVAKAQTRWVFVDLKTGRPVLIPDTIKDSFIEVDQES